VIFLLAQGSPATNPGAVGAWVLIAIAVMGGLLVLINLASYFATRREVAALERRIETHERLTKEVTDDLFTKVGGVERGVRGELKGDIEKLREEIKEAGAGVAGLVATVQQVNQSLTSAHARLDRFVERSHS